MPQVLVPLAPGFEELEAITIIDILRRADINVISAGLASGTVRASRNTVHIPDMTLDEALQQQYDMVVLPGGLPGADNLDNDHRIATLIQAMNHEKKYIGAICAAPKVLASKGLLADKQATAYSGVLAQYNLTSSKQAVVHDENIITSQGPGTALDFALYLIEVLCGKAKRDEVETPLLRQT